jgi:hypothetical protein
MDYPYQLVTFLNDEPQIGEAIYGGQNGWYPHIALKRRFDVQGIGEGELILDISRYLETIHPFNIHIGEAKKLDHMPIEVIEVKDDSPIKNFNSGFIEFMGSSIASKFGEREGEKYCPYITLEYWGERQFNPRPFEKTTLKMNSLWLVKDNQVSDEAFAYRKFVLED